VSCPTQLLPRPSIDRGGKNPATVSTPPRTQRMVRHCHSLAIVQVGEVNQRDRLVFLVAPVQAPIGKLSTTIQRMMEEGSGLAKRRVHERPKVEQISINKRRNKNTLYKGRT
jgi:hypothetical protein